MLHHYIRAKVTLAVLSLVFFSLATLLLRFPHFLALGLLAGVLEFIPVAGWMISAVAILGIGAMTHAHWIWMAALIALWRMLMDYGISPRVMGHELEIHPVMAIFAVMVGRSCRRHRGDLSFCAADRHIARHLPKICRASGGYDTDPQFCPQSGPKG